ncbi:glycosyltransferase family 61 protein [Pseudoroseomonas cervicalis]|uniref:glycosyltransferase family 61 protein n=1 Tax=Teichococcus cervicalis TaxID=204525 RepID=UPI0027D7EBA4|nr:glycosyltransferase family 61 protein [Pseudoroseomonas cervicalis]
MAVPTTNPAAAAADRPAAPAPRPEAGEGARPRDPAAALLKQGEALAEAGDAPGLLAWLAGLTDAEVPPRALSLLVRAGRALGQPALLRRAVALGGDPSLPPSPRVLLAQALLNDRSAEAALAAWRVLSAAPGLFASASAPNALRCLALLGPRLPPGAARQEAVALLAAHRDSFPDPAELAALEAREGLRALAQQRDWAGLCRLAATLPDAALNAEATGQLLTAALQTRDAEAARRALALSPAELEKPKRRIWYANRLRMAGLGEAALALLDVPALTEATDPETRDALLDMLSQFLGSGVRGALAQSLQALAARLSAPVFTAEEMPLPPPLLSPAPPRDAALELHAAPGVSAALRAAFGRQLEQSRQLMRRPRDEAAGLPARPRLLLCRDVAVDETGRVWDAQGRVAPIYHRLLPPDLPPLPEGPALAEAVLATETPRNFYHWFAEGLPALAWRLRPDAPRLPILYTPRIEGFLRATLDLLGDSLGEVPALLRVEAPLRVERGWISPRGMQFLYHAEYFADLYARLVAQAMRQAAPGVSGPRLYLSRRDVPRRGIENEVELEEALRRLGFTVMTFQGVPLARQIRAFQEAEVVVSPHGAGLAHLVAARPGLKVFELLPAWPGTEKLRSCYSRVSAFRGHHHAIWLEPVDPVTQGWRVQLAPMLAALQRFLDAPRPQGAGGPAPVSPG